MTLLSKIQKNYHVEAMQESHTGRILVVGYFHELQKIKREIFENLDMCHIQKRQDGKFLLSICFNL